MSNNKTLTRKLIRENCQIDARALDIAVMKGMTDMVMIMIQGGARWDKAAYLHKMATKPRYLYDCPEMLSWLHYSLTTVDSLSQSARNAIRRHSRPGLPGRVADFGLPTRLCEYVLLTAEMADEYYDEW